MDKLLELAERVEALTGPDREVDRLIALACLGYKEDRHHPSGLVDENSHVFFGFPAFTQSIDAARTLGKSMPWLCPIMDFSTRTVRLVNGLGLPVGGKDYASCSEDMACALSASWLRALATQERGE